MTPVTSSVSAGLPRDTLPVRGGSGSRPLSQSRVASWLCALPICIDIPATRGNPLLPCGYFRFRCKQDWTEILSWTPSTLLSFRFGLLTGFTSDAPLRVNQQRFFRTPGELLAVSLTSSLSCYQVRDSSNQPSKLTYF